MRSVISFCRLTRHWTLSLLGTDLLLRGMGLGLASRACDPCGHTWCALRGVLSLGSAVTILKFWGMFKQGLCICILPEPRTSYSWFYVGHGCLHMRIPMDHVLWGSWSCSCSWALWAPHSTKQSRHSVHFWIEPKMTKKEMKKKYQHLRMSILEISRRSLWILEAILLSRGIWGGQSSKHINSAFRILLLLPMLPELIGPNSWNT